MVRTVYILYIYIGTRVWFSHGSYIFRGELWHIASSSEFLVHRHYLHILSAYICTPQLMFVFPPLPGKMFFFLTVYNPASHRRQSVESGREIFLSFHGSHNYIFKHQQMWHIYRLSRHPFWRFPTQSCNHGICSIFRLIHGYVPNFLKARKSTRHCNRVPCNSKLWSSLAGPKPFNYSRQSLDKKWYKIKATLTLINSKLLSLFLGDAPFNQPDLMHLLLCHCSIVSCNWMIALASD